MKVLILQACTLGKSLHFLGNMIHLPVTGTGLVSDENRLDLVPALEELDWRQGRGKGRTRHTNKLTTKQYLLKIWSLRKTPWDLGQEMTNSVWGP